MEPKYRRCCGIDVHKKSVTVCVLPPVGKLRTWLKNCTVTEIAMESTGQYWRAIWNVLEGHCEKLILVNPQHIFALAQRDSTAIRPIPRMPSGLRDCSTAAG